METYTTIIEDSFGNKSFQLDSDEVPEGWEVISKGLSWEEAQSWVNRVNSPYTLRKPRGHTKAAIPNNQTQ